MHPGRQRFYDATWCRRTSHKLLGVTVKFLQTVLVGRTCYNRSVANHHLIEVTVKVCSGETINYYCVKAESPAPLHPSK